MFSFSELVAIIFVAIHFDSLHFSHSRKSFITSYTSSFIYEMMPIVLSVVSWIFVSDFWLHFNLLDCYHSTISEWHDEQNVCSYCGGDAVMINIRRIVTMHFTVLLFIDFYCFSILNNAYNMCTEQLLYFCFDTVCFVCEFYVIFLSRKAKIRIVTREKRKE